MEDGMKLGVMIESQEGVGWNEWRNIVQWTEELGFESLWRSDPFFSFCGPSRTVDSLDTLVAHTYTAASTRRIRFGPLVLSMTFRNPAILARMAAAIDQLSGGRFIPGIGAGWPGEKRTLRIVARYATEWNTAGGPVDVYRHKVQVLEQHCEAEKRDPKTIDRSLMCSYVTGATQADIDRQVDAMMARMPPQFRPPAGGPRRPLDRKSTRLKSRH